MRLAHVLTFSALAGAVVGFGYLGLAWADETSSEGTGPHPDPAFSVADPEGGQVLPVPYSPGDNPGAVFHLTQLEAEQPYEAGPPV